MKMTLPRIRRSKKVLILLALLNLANDYEEGGGAGCSLPDVDDLLGGSLAVSHEFLNLQGGKLSSVITAQVVPAIHTDWRWSVEPEKGDWFTVEFISKKEGVDTIRFRVKATDLASQVNQKRVVIQGFVKVSLRIEAFALERGEKIGKPLIADVALTGHTPHIAAGDTPVGAPLLCEEGPLYSQTYKVENRSGLQWDLTATIEKLNVLHFVLASISTVLERTNIF